ncbi:MAG: hypothetical protein WBP64_09135 [Nitrososphaeraceae archaeon]
MLDCTTNIDRVKATSVTDNRASAATNFTGQTILQNNVTSSQSSDIRDIRKLTSEALRLTLRATDKQTSRYFKAMIWALIIPVVALILVYQIGILLGNPILIYKVNEPFFFVSLLLSIPTIIIIFLLIAERKLVGRLHQKDQQ